MRSKVVSHKWVDHRICDNINLIYPPIQCDFGAFCTYLIFVLFSPQTKSVAQFFSTRRVNRDKTDIATKQRKLHKSEILQQNRIKCNKTSKIVHIMTDFPHISHVEKFLHVTEFPHIDHVEKFST